MRVAILGGSSVASIQLAAALHRWPGGQSRRPDLEIALHGRNPAKLQMVGARFRSATSDIASCTWGTDLESALDNADVVLVQVRIGGLVARRFDETFPWAAQLPGEETLGPGGFANAVRTLRALDQVWLAIRMWCAEAKVVILTNPAGILRSAAASRGLNAVEVCDSPVALAEDIAKRISRGKFDVIRRYCGMNHIGWYVPTSDKELERLATRRAVGADVVQAHGAVPLDYLRYYVEADEVFNSQHGRPTRAEELMEIERVALHRLERGESPDPDARPAPWYELAVLPLLDALVNGSQDPLIVGCANQRRVDVLPDDATVEGPVTFSKHGDIQLLDTVDLPPVPLQILYRHATYEKLAIAAAQSLDTKSALRALFANPMVSTANQARALAGVIVSGDGGNFLTGPDSTT